MRRALLLFALSLGPLAAAPDDGWLNARDCGASGSQFTTTATTTAGSADITVADPGDFQVGQGIMLSKCHPQMVDQHLWGPKVQYTAGSGRSLKGLIDLRGYDQQAGSWCVYMVDIERVDPPQFRWSADMGRTWTQPQPITFDWQPLRGGLDLRFQKYAWADGYTATFSARDQLVSTVVKVAGQVITLKDPVPTSVTGAVVRHSDTEALQAAIDRALKERRHLYLPVGWYRLTRGLTASRPQSLVIEGANSVDTVIDISEGMGCCLMFRDGVEATVRNLSFLGNMGFAERDQCGSIRVHGCSYVWGQDLKTSFATGVVGTERVLVENCHARRMSLEAFWSGGPSRSGTNEPKQYTKAITYLRCSAIDCGRNGFNNNDLAENTSILQCRIVDVGGCAWEGASRFVKFCGNYVRNAGTVAIGNVSTREEAIEVLPSGQHIVTDNVFEGGVPYGGCAIRTASGSSPVLIANNLFVNFNGSAIELSGYVSTGYGLPASDSTVTGNLIDLTCTDGAPKPRIGIQSSQTGVVIANNQICVRGAADPQVTGIALREPALSVTVHDNQLRNCGLGLGVTRAVSRVGEVPDPQTLVISGGTVPLEKRRSHRYRGWHLVLLRGNKVIARTVVDSYDVLAYRFHLKAPSEARPGDLIEVYPPYGAAWNLHDNLFSDCLGSLTLDGYGSDASLVRDNLFSRQATVGVKQAVEVRGRYQLTGNRFVGFDEAGCTALSLFADRFGQAPASQVSGNVFQNCTAVLKESQPGLWAATARAGNLFIDCRQAPAE